ncbi:hypothetical protein HGRIS_003019 [Hohenbuehelia grisea]|uniref:Uncharacterized protein n=1 Tax=Hohenbuehelia grisea TaxID=104357 RepID=A0ABR3JM75_9AGAR
MQSGKANTLLADHLFSPALFLAERIERGLLAAPGQSVVELGAGCALPSLLLATCANPPSKVVVTDFPDDTILVNLRKNVERNEATFRCSVHCEGYEWGKPVDTLRNYADHPSGFDIVILSDLLHFDQSHDVLISSAASLLARTPSARVHVCAGNYTRIDVCESFIRDAEKAGLIFDVPPTDGDIWLGDMEVSGLDKTQLAKRKGVCYYWVGRWRDLD